MRAPEHLDYLMAHEKPDDLYNITAAAQFLGLSSDYLRRLTDGGKIKARRTPAGHRLYTRRDLETFMEVRRKNPPQRGRPPMKKLKEKRSPQ